MNLLELNGVSPGRAAWYYLHLGWHIFPVKKYGKTPATPRGFHDATNLAHAPEMRADAAQFFEEKSFNIGLATGFTFDVLDVDVKNGVDGMRALSTLRDKGLLDGYVAAANTPSGGVHLFYPASGRRSSYISGMGLDFKAQGGYVVLSPSVTLDYESGAFSDHAYEWRWSGDLNGGKPLDWDAAKAALGAPASVRKWEPLPGVAPVDVVAGLVSWYARNAAEGERNRCLFWAASRACESGADQSDMYGLRDAAVMSGLSPSEVDKTIESAFRES